MDTIEPVLLLTGEARTRDAVEATAAALGLAVAVVAEVDAALERWAASEVVLVGSDRAGPLAAFGPRRRPGVYVVGPEAAELGTWSAPLGAPVIPLPQGLAWLTSVLAADTDSDSRLVAVVGGSGGVGASTLAVGLALAAVRRGLSAALVDVDPLGGGIDLLLGAERAPGWRWPRLHGARGEVGDVRGVLPSIGGVAVVAMGRGEGAETPPAESVHAVLGSLRRHHDLVVLDAGRAPLAGVRPAVRGADRTILVSGSGVVGVAASARVRDTLDLDEPGLVVRAERGGAPGSVIAGSLALPLWGTLPRDRRVASAAEAGVLPPASGRWPRAVTAVLERVRTEAES